LAEAEDAMPTREADAEWTGDLQSGRGQMHLSADFDRAFDVRSRLESGESLHPEDLIGAAHAGCFSMALADRLVSQGYAPQRIHTHARVHLDQRDGGWRIERIDLETEAAVKGLGARELREAAETTKAACPVSKALAGVDIGLTTRLIEPR
jgi:lipoyl-dependent peroxiredoxin